MATLRPFKAKLDMLKQLEAQLDEKDKKINDQSRQMMMQEQAIQGWLDTIETKKKIIREKEKRCDQLEAENGALVSKNAENASRIKKLELACADANSKAIQAENTVAAAKRLSESLSAQKQDLESQIKAKCTKEK